MDLVARLNFRCQRLSSFLIAGLMRMVVTGIVQSFFYLLHSATVVQSIGQASEV
jgi:hypothetical protein